jgi:hypothetical protein
LFFAGFGVVGDVGEKRVERSRDALGRWTRTKPEGSVEDGEAAGPAKKEKKERPVRDIEEHTDVEFRRAFPKICQGLLKKAEGGSTAHTRLLLEIGKSDKKLAAKRRGQKSLGEMLLDELKRRQDEREAAADKARAEQQVDTTANEGVASGEGVENK